MVTVRSEVIDDAIKYNPQPFSLDCLVENVITESIPLIKPPINIAIVNPQLHLIIVD
jgi:hypothetical protein